MLVHFPLKDMTAAKDISALETAGKLALPQRPVYPSIWIIVIPHPPKVRKRGVAIFSEDFLSYPE